MNLTRIPDNAPHLESKEELLKRLTGHELLKPGNQYCKHCGEAMYTSAARKQCKGAKP